MPKNFKLVLEYDGSAFHGWQRQKNERTVQGEIEKALQTMTGQKINLCGSGRTDAGVHALGQAASFRCDTRLSADVFLKGINSLVPRDLVVKSCEPVPERFHARFDAGSKTYRYRILNRATPSALFARYCWFISKKLDMDAMRGAVGFIVGEHDFKAFEGSGSPRSSTVRRVMRAELFERDLGMIEFEVEADGFLRFMVRNIVGTLVDVGLSKISPADFEAILFSRDRSRAGITAPPQGLFLVEVKYDPDAVLQTCR